MNGNRRYLDPLLLYCGPMCSEKSNQLIAAANRRWHAREDRGQPLIFLKPPWDVRDKGVNSRVGNGGVEALVLPGDVSGVVAALEQYIGTPAIIGIDEIHFLGVGEAGEDPRQPSVDEAIWMHHTLLRLAEKGSALFLAGLDADFALNPFPLVARLLLDPRVRRKQLTAICSRCRREGATLTQRLCEGKPVPRTEPALMVEKLGDGKDAPKHTYEPRCFGCHELPDA